MDLSKLLVLFFSIFLNSYGMAFASTDSRSHRWIVKIETEYTDELTRQKVVLGGAGTLFRFDDYGKERWFILTVAHVTQGHFYDAFVVDDSGKPIYKFSKVSSTTTKTKINEAIDHLTDSHIFEVQVPPQNIIKKENVPFCQMTRIRSKGDDLDVVGEARNLYRLYLPEKLYTPEDQYSLAVQLTVPHISWVPEKGFVTKPSKMSQLSSIFGLRFYWTDKEYSVDSRVVRGMSGLPALTFDARRMMWMVLGTIKSFHRKRMETYIVSDRGISGVFAALIDGKQANPDQEGISISWRFRSPYGTYRFFENANARFSEISALNPNLSLAKAGGNEAGDGGGNETGDGGGNETGDGGGNETGDGGEAKIGAIHDGFNSKPEMIEWQWRKEKSSKNIGAFSFSLPAQGKGEKSDKHVWISAAIRSLEYLGFSQIFKDTSLLKAHALNKKTLQAALSERMTFTSELFKSNSEPSYCQIYLNKGNDKLDIFLRFPYHPDFNFSQNSNNSYSVSLSFDQLLGKGFNTAVNNLNLNVEGLFFFNPISSYAENPTLAKNQAYTQLLTSHVVLKDTGNRSNRSIILPCVSGSSSNE